MLNCFKSKKDILKEEISRALENEPSVDNLFEIFCKFEKDNLAAIKKLNKDKDADLRKINGATFCCNSLARLAFLNLSMGIE